MIDSITKEPIRVDKYPEAWPYIRLPLDQLDQVKKLLDGADIRYSVDEDAISFNDQPYTAVVNLAHDVDVSAVQKLLDEHKSRRMARPTKPVPGTSSSMRSRTRRVEPKSSSATARPSWRPAYDVRVLSSSGTLVPSRATRCRA